MENHGKNLPSTLACAPETNIPYQPAPIVGLHRVTYAINVGSTQTVVCVEVHTSHNLMTLVDVRSPHIVYPTVKKYNSIGTERCDDMYTLKNERHYSNHYGGSWFGDSGVNRNSYRPTDSKVIQAGSLISMDSIKNLSFDSEVVPSNIQWAFDEEEKMQAEVNDIVVEANKKRYETNKVFVDGKSEDFKLWASARVGYKRYLALDKQCDKEREAYLERPFWERRIKFWFINIVIQEAPSRPSKNKIISDITFSDLTDEEIQWCKDDAIEYCQDNDIPFK